MQSVLEATGVIDAILRLDVDQYHRLCASGIVPEKTELLEGIVVEKMGKSPLHSWTVGFLAEWFRSNLRDGLLLRIEQPLTFAKSEPEPDVAIVGGGQRDYRDHHPDSAMLVVEVAITTTSVDRAKATVYANAGIPEFWLVLPNEKTIAVFRSPNVGGYQLSESFDAASVLSSALCRAPLRIADLFAE